VLQKSFELTIELMGQVSVSVQGESEMQLTDKIVLGAREDGYIGLFSMTFGQIVERVKGFWVAFTQA